MQNIRMIITDLDGTLLNSQRKVSDKDLQTLQMLGNQEIIRVAATGRNYFMTRKVLQDDFPFDYLIFSSGSGIINWKTKELIYSCNLPAHSVSYLLQHFFDHNISFMLHRSIPENHWFFYHKGLEMSIEFDKRVENYNGYAHQFPLQDYMPQTESQFLVIVDHEHEIEAVLPQKMPQIRVIRATSPYSDKSIWLEFFHETVSKGSATQWLCYKLQISDNQTLGIGNDYNDVDLLDFTKFSYVMGNAPRSLKQKYNVKGDNNNDGFSNVVELFL